MCHTNYYQSIDETGGKCYYAARCKSVTSVRDAAASAAATTTTTAVTQFITDVIAVTQLTALTAVSLSPVDINHNQSLVTNLAA